MNVLIISIVRSGSSRLLESIASHYNQKGIFEPTTPRYKKDFDSKKDIVKIVIQTLTIEEHLELIQNFDNLILLDRKDIVAQSESYLNLWYQLDGNYNKKYIGAKFSKKQINETIEKLKNWKSDLKKISKIIKKPIIYLEDLLEAKDIDGIEYDKDFFTEEYKLRQFKNKSLI
jgi:hypothetical protein